MRAHLTSRLLAAAALTTVAARASGQVVVTDPGAPFVATALTGFATAGADMGGMTVTATFTDGTSAGGVWGDLGGGTWGVSLPQFSLTMPGVSDTFSDPWRLLGGAAGGPLGIRRLVINAAPGRTVFDYINGAFLTPGSANGNPMAIVGGDLFGTVATYRNRVQIGAAAPLGDLFETLDITFQAPIGPNGLQFIADTDNIDRGGSITRTPEPATYGMLAFGLGALLLARRRRLAVAA
jgi:hypothetical protein